MPIDMDKEKDYENYIEKIRKIRLAGGRSGINKPERSNNFKPKEYKEFVKIHTKTLEKYIYAFSIWFSVWLLKRKNYDFARKAIKKKSLEMILSRARPIRIQEVIALFKIRDLKKEFLEYLYNKTMLSYEVYPNLPFPILYNGKYNGPFYAKLAEFIFIILAEYIVLHNYMWNSFYKTEKINTIDKFIKNI